MATTNWHYQRAFLSIRTTVCEKGSDISTRYVKTRINILLLFLRLSPLAVFRKHYKEKEENKNKNKRGHSINLNHQKTYQGVQRKMTKVQKKMAITS